MRTHILTVLAVLTALWIPNWSFAQKTPDSGVSKLEVLRLAGLPGAMRGRLDVDSKRWPQKAEVLLEDVDLVKLGYFWTQADATLDLPDPGYHSFVKVFAEDTKLLASARKYGVTLKVADESGVVLGSTTVLVDPTQPPPVVALTYGGGKEVKAKLKIEVVRSGARDRVVVSVSDSAYGMAHAVNVELVAYDKSGNPLGASKPLSLAMVRSFVRLQASAWDVDTIIDSVGLWQQTLPTVWSSDTNGDGKMDLWGEATLELDVRDVEMQPSSLNPLPEEGFALDISLLASSVQYLLGGLDVWIWTESSDKPLYFWMPPVELKPEFLVEIPFSSDPVGTPLEVSVQLYNQYGKGIGAAETCSFTVKDKAKCKTTSGIVLRVGGWGGGSWAGSGSTTVSSSLQLRVIAPAQGAFEPSSWPYKVGISAAAKSENVKVAGPAKLRGSRTTSWNAYDATLQEGILGFDGDAPGPFTIQIRTIKGIDTPSVGATFKLDHWGGILIDEVKFEVE